MGECRRTVITLGLFLALVLLPASAAASPVGAAGPAGPGGGANEGADRVLLMSLPGVTWSDVAEHNLENIERFLADAAAANHAPRGVYAASRPGAAYLTISAGTRAAGRPSTDGELLAVDDRAAGSAAGEIFQRRTGVAPAGDYVTLDWATLVERNDARPYDPELGLLQETLAEAGLGIGVVANADGTDTIATSYERSAGLAVATPDGEVLQGDLDVDLLVGDTARAFGLRMDLDRAEERARELWGAQGAEGGGLVLVEASDLARTLRYRTLVDEARYDTLWAQALQEADELFGRLLERVDPERDAVLLLGPYNQRGDRDLTVAALREPGAAPATREGGTTGYLTSASSQRTGYVTLVDVAPTVLDQLGLERPESMEGRPLQVVQRADGLDERVDRLVAGNDASRFRENLLVPTTLVVVVVLGLMAALALVVTARPAAPSWIAAAARGVALWALAVLPLSFLARAFPLQDLGLGFYWLFVLSGALVLVVVGMVVGRLAGRPPLTLMVVLGFTVGLLAFDVVTGARMSMSAPFGYSPTGNSRLYGFSNYAFGMFGASVTLLAGLLASSVRSRRPRARMVPPLILLVAALVVIGVPAWGANVGGTLSFAPAVVVFASVAFGTRVRPGLLAACLGAAAGAIGLFAVVDLLRPAEERAHLGRLVERVGEEGVGPLFDIMSRKLDAAFGVTTTSFWTAAVLTALVYWVCLNRLPERPWPVLRARLPGLRAGLAAALVLAGVGSLLNDSGSIVGGTAMVVVVVSLIWLTLDPSVRAAGRADSEVAAEVVDEPQRGDAADDPAEGDPLAEEIEGEDDDQHAGADAGGAGQDDADAEPGSEHVGSGVAEHEVLP